MLQFSKLTNLNKKKGSASNVLAWALLDFDKEDRETQRATTSAAGIGRFG
jgi:hypothetical protein